MAEQVSHCCEAGKIAILSDLGSYSASRIKVSMDTAAQADVTIITVVRLGKGSGAVFLSLPYCIKLHLDLGNVWPNVLHIKRK